MRNNLIEEARSFLNEEMAKPRRAWSNKIEKLDKLMAWMYDKDLLTKTEKDEKDRLFRRYYRYYNDGDFPKGLKTASGDYTLSKFDDETRIETALEKTVEDFMKKILSKYNGKYNRKEFRLDTMLEALNDVKNSLDSKPVSFSDLKYWAGKIIKYAGETNLADLLNKYEPVVKDVQDKLIALGATKNYGPSYQIKELDDKGIKISPEIKQLKRDLLAIQEEINDIVDDLIYSVKESKKLLKPETVSEKE